MSEGNGYLTADLLLSATAVRYTDFVIPDDYEIEALAGQKLRVKSLNAKERASLEDFFLDPRTGRVNPEKDKLRAEKWVIDCVVDGSGRPLFTLEDIRKLSKVDGALIEEIAQCAVNHNRVQLGKDLEKKSEAMTDSGSS